MNKNENTKHLLIVVESTEHCPDCEQEKIKEELYSYILDDDLEEAFNIACDRAKQCKDCHEIEMADNDKS